MTAQDVLFPTKQPENVIGLVIAGVLFVTMIVLNHVRPNPSPSEQITRRVFLALFAGLVANYIAGTVDAGLSGGIRATGAIAVTLIIYLINPGSSPVAPALMFATLGLLLGGRAQAEVPKPDWIVVFDLTRVEKDTASGGDALTSRTFSFDPDSEEGRKFQGNPNGIDLANFETVYGSAVHRTRWIGRRGQSVTIYVRRLSEQTYDLKPEELPRDTQFAGDLSKLLRSVSGEARTFASTDYKTDERTYMLTRTRATLKLTVTLTIPESYPFGSGTVPAAPEPLTAVLVTGPREHLYLSTGVPFKSIDEFKVDDTNAIVLNEVPKKFLIGVHWQIGDVLTADHVNALDGFNLGFQLQADSKPLEHAVLSVGYRVQEGMLPGTGLQFVTPFIGLQRSENDRDEGTSGIQQHTVWQAVWGISLNLDKALGWLKPE